MPNVRPGISKQGFAVVVVAYYLVLVTLNNPVISTVLSLAMVVSLVLRVKRVYWNPSLATQALFIIVGLVPFLNIFPLLYLIFGREQTEAPKKHTVQLNFDLNFSNRNASPINKV